MRQITDGIKNQDETDNDLQQVKVKFIKNEEIKASRK